MRRLAVIALLGSLVALTFSHTRAEVRRVPQDFPSIQSALDVTAHDDSVLVSLGTYAEELTTPPLRFWLIGDVEVDTGDFERPTIDPSTLDSAQWRKCMYVSPGSEPIIERMGFVNRSPMFPRGDFTTGGVSAGSELLLTFRYCSFDSVWRAIVQDNPTLYRRYLVEDCRFTYGSRGQVVALLPAGCEVRRCYFHTGRGGSEFVNSGPNSIIEECYFTGDSVWRAVCLLGLESPVALRNCVFASIDSCNSVFRVWRSANAVVEDNLFSDIGCGDFDFASISCHYDLPIIFRHNVLRNVSTYGAGISTGLSLYRDQGSAEFVAEVDSNLFVNYVSGMNNNRGKAFHAESQVTATGNHFVNLQPDSLPVVYHLPGGYSVLRFNQFEMRDYGVGSYGGGGADAIWNWWGHESGPFNAIHNPTGQGARVDDAVLFDPWCLDTNCFLSAPGIGTPLPEEFVLEAYPNPFNSALHLTLIPAEVGIVKVEFFDVLGRRVSEIWRGPLAFQKEITFDGSSLASGIYFARVTDVISRKNLATTKVVLLK